MHQTFADISWPLVTDFASQQLETVNVTNLP
jgi:hypothetical protein